MLMKSVRALLLLALLGVAVGCAPSDQGGDAGSAQSLAMAEGSEAGALTGEGTSSAYSSEAGDERTAADSTPEASIIVDDPSVTIEPPAPGSITSGSGPGLIEGGSPSITEGLDDIGATERDEPTVADVPTWPVYTDQTYGFSISYPPYYVVEALGVTDFAGFEPVPLSAVYFQDEDVAKSDTADLASPAFSIRVYENKTQQPLEEWLASAGLLKAGQDTEPYKGSHESGLSVYSRYYMAPGWFVYIAGDGVVYQLTPMGPTGELMLDTFDIRN